MLSLRSGPGSKSTPSWELAPRRPGTTSATRCMSCTSSPGSGSRGAPFRASRAGWRLPPSGAKGRGFRFRRIHCRWPGKEFTIGDVNSYVPVDHRWYRAADIPVPVDSAVIGMSHDRYVYLVGGRSKAARSTMCRCTTPRKIPGAGDAVSRRSGFRSCRRRSR